MSIFDDLRIDQIIGETINTLLCETCAYTPPVNNDDPWSKQEPSWQEIRAFKGDASQRLILAGIAQLTDTVFIIPIVQNTGFEPKVGGHIKWVNGKQYKIIKIIDEPSGSIYEVVCHG